MEEDKEEKKERADKEMTDMVGRHKGRDERGREKGGRMKEKGGQDKRGRSVRIEGFKK